MSEYRIAVRLRVPDNTAYTALVALRRLGVPVERVERARLVVVEARNAEEALGRVRRDEALFNPNLHDAEVVARGAPEAGEIWVRSGLASSAKAWRLCGSSGVPLERAELEAARDALLCNPAIETAVVGS